MYRIARELGFCYGHRLMLHDGKCAHLHGHNARVVVVLEAASVDASGMVVDFQVVRSRIGDWIDAEFDHRMLLHRDDPAFVALRALGEPVVGLDFHPTAEHLARHVFEHARAAGLPVVEVEFWETPTCRAVYCGR